MRLALPILMLLATANAATVDVTSFGASGDLTNITVATTAASSSVTALSGSFTDSDVGKLILIVGAGETSTGTNNQDYIGTISGVSQATNLTVSPAASVSLASAAATVGSNNAQPFRDAFLSLASTNDIVLVPSGNYLVVSPYMLTNGTAFGEWVGLPISRGGFTLRGVGSPTITSCGAFQWRDGAGVRGVPVSVICPVTNNYPVTIEGITFDGGVAQGFQSNHGFPITPAGNGWDVTHDAIWFQGQPPIWNSLTIQNCAFNHWRGEVLKSTIGQTTTGAVTLANCTFYDGNASAINYGFNQTTTDCTVDQFYIAGEIWQGYMTQPSFLLNCVMTNVSSGLTVNGALTNAINPTFTISGNQLSGRLFLNPAVNLVIANNLFTNGTVYAGASGYQGSEINRDWLIVGNTFSNTTLLNGIQFGGVPAANILVTSNSFVGCQFVASGVGDLANVVFTHNTCTNGFYGVIDNRTITTEWIDDDPSNAFAEYQVGDSTGSTNYFGYEYGYRHKTISVVPGSVFVLDDSKTTLTPTGARLQVRHTGSYAAQFRTSLNGQRRLIQVGDVVHYHFDGSVWRDDAVSQIGILRAGSLQGR